MLKVLNDVISPLQVAFQVTVLEGNIHVNGLKAQHGSVTAFHFHAEIGKICIILKIPQGLPTKFSSLCKIHKHFNFQD
jgi:hypothetical protein